VTHVGYPNALQPVHLQKALFLLDRKLNATQKGAENIYSFKPYDYGPFDAAVYIDAENLEREGLIQIQRQPGQTYRRYAITPEGQLAGNRLGAQLPSGVLDYTRALVEWVQRLPFNDLVSAVYKEYPEMKANSVFRG
jgi:hypothetical protein